MVVVLLRMKNVHPSLASGAYSIHDQVNVIANSAIWHSMGSVSCRSNTVNRYMVLALLLNTARTMNVNVAAIHADVRFIEIPKTLLHVYES